MNILFLLKCHATELFIIKYFIHSKKKKKKDPGVVDKETANLEWLALPSSVWSRAVLLLERPRCYPMALFPEAVMEIMGKSADLRIRRESGLNLSITFFY